MSPYRTASPIVHDEVKEVLPPKEGDVIRLVRLRSTSPLKAYAPNCDYIGAIGYVEYVLLKHYFWVRLQNGNKSPLGVFLHIGEIEVIKRVRPV